MEIFLKINTLGISFTSKQKNQSTSCQNPAFHLPIVAVGPGIIPLENSNKFPISIGVNVFKFDFFTFIKHCF